MPSEGNLLALGIFDLHVVSVEAETVPQEHRQAEAIDPQHNHDSDLAEEAEGDDDEHECREVPACIDVYGGTFTTKDDDDTLLPQGFQRADDGDGERERDRESLIPHR